MAMRRVLLLSLVLLAAGAIPASARAASCSLPGARTIARDAQARVFTVAGHSRVRRRYYGCLKGRRPKLPGGLPGAGMPGGLPIGGAGPVG